MIIGIDASRATTALRTGTEAYATNLIRALVPLAAEQGHHLRLYFNQPPTPELAADFAPAEIVAIPRPRLWTHTRLRAELAQRPPDVFFTPAHVIPVGYRGPAVATIHDLGYEFFPEAHTAGQRAYLRWSTRHNGRRATTVIADSQATKSDLERLYGLGPRKIEVVYPGADPTLGPPPDDEVAAVRAAYELNRPYLLYLGTLQPRKNLARLVEAFGSSGLAGEGYELVLAGRSGWLTESILAAVTAQGDTVAASIRMTGYVPEDHKAALLAGATALVFPSLYEGFGFPVLEAQACGTAVICSNTSSLPEVAGSAALLVDPLDTAALAAAMSQVVGDDALRARLVRDGLANVRRFRWEQTAAQVLDILISAAAG